MFLKNIKNYTKYICMIILFIVVIGYSFYIYFNWNEKLDGNEQSIEISLPILDLDEYSNLSKQY